MANQYTQVVNNAQTRFTNAPMGELEFSRMISTPQVLTTFNAGDIVPIYCEEILPNSTYNIDLDYVIRQATALVPSMGQMECDVYAFFVPNRIVNHSWKNVMGENTSGAWTAPEVSLVPLLADEVADSVQIPVGSIADYYGFPTQMPIPADILRQCNDLKFRGYLEIYNNYFRDQNYQPPIPYSKLNIYEGFLQPVGTSVGIDYLDYTDTPTNNGIPDGSSPGGAVVKAVYGDGFVPDSSSQVSVSPRNTAWSALSAPLKANKFHDYFTSVLPSPQKHEGSIMVSSLGIAPVYTDGENVYAQNYPLTWTSMSGDQIGQSLLGLDFNQKTVVGGATGINLSNAAAAPNNLVADLSQASGFTIDDLRMSSAIQQVFEILGRSGSRYREFINAFFGLDVDNPFDDIPTCIGHVRRGLDLYQTAQTSATVAGGTPQASLAAFGYTNKGGHVTQKTFIEHGYLHILCVVRHRNIYSSLLTRDNFRMNMLDFYSYPLANISEQPVYTREINPFASETDGVFGYQEAWAEYRMSPDRVSGYMRPGVNLSLSMWNYADEFDSGLEIADGSWIKSNSSEVLDRGTSSSEEYAPQFKAQFMFKIDKQLPMPTYSVAGLDII